MHMSEFLHKYSVGPVVPQTFTKDYGDEGFKLESGKTLPALTIRYETYGTLNADKSNVVWVCSPLTADAHVAGYYTENDKKPGWWDALIGPGKPVDTDKFFVVCSNILGGCKGTTGPTLCLCKNSLICINIAYSNIIVNGPSLVKLTCMSAPKRPVCTTGISFLHSVII